ncbi:uncharacterized protein [Apostichopus japonicus]|uniref:uncharacterized protein n=1 Tax=Stichopus japonicus TaxID=307972 RepID=UPI003AB7C35F
MNQILLASLFGIVLCSISSFADPIQTKESQVLEFPENDAEDTDEVLRRLKMLKDHYSDLLRRSDDTRKILDDISKQSQRRKRDVDVNPDVRCCDESRTMRIPGRRGADGHVGEKGMPGERGPMGDPGQMGTTGSPGEPGEHGMPGDKGSNGTTGSPGETGSMGNTGLPGPRGLPGIKGDPSNAGTVHSTYIRWGRKDCRGDTELVYEGYAAGAAYNEKGGGADYLCLPKDPQFLHTVPGTTSSWRARIHGAEYEVNSFDPFNGMDNGDVPCAVCLVNGRSSVLMQPARYTCPHGWTYEYSGYLMASHHGYYRTKWVCVDENAQLTTQESLSNLDGALFYPVVSECHSSVTGLPCTEYGSNNELTCSVCTS